MSALRLTSEHMRRFAEASGDRNPLHLDESFARTTPYGRCIAQGALVTTAALGRVEPELLERLERLDVQFRQPVFPDESYTVSRQETRIEVTRGGRLAVAITLEAGETPLPVVAELRATARAEPLRRTLEELESAEPLREPYGCDLPALAALAEELGASGVPEAVLAWLAAASYTVGMLAPGLDAVFAGARVARSSEPDSGTLAATVTAVDDRTGLVAVDVVLERGEASARMALHGFLRPRVPLPDREALALRLPPSDALAGRDVLVVGASRGLGAAVAAALATQGATVWAAFARSADRLEELRSEFGHERIRPLQFDAEDPDETRHAFAALPGTLHGAVFCAAPPLGDASVHPEATEATLRFVHSSLALTLVPLAETLQVLEPGGRLVFVSSAALEDPPDAWPHYVTAKAALEGVAAHCARRAGASVLVVRPPRLWTDSTNTPLARLEATPTEDVAAAVARWVLDPGDPSGAPTVLGPDELRAD